MEKLPSQTIFLLPINKAIIATFWEKNKKWIKNKSIYNIFRINYPTHHPTSPRAWPEYLEIFNFIYYLMIIIILTVSYFPNSHLFCRASNPTLFQNWKASTSFLQWSILLFQFIKTIKFWGVAEKKLKMKKEEWKQRPRKSNSEHLQSDKIIHFWACSFTYLDLQQWIKKEGESEREKEIEDGHVPSDGCKVAFWAVDFWNERIYRRRMKEKEEKSEERAIWAAAASTSSSHLRM